MFVHLWLTANINSTDCLLMLNSIQSEFCLHGSNYMTVYGLVHTLMSQTKTPRLTIKGGEEQRGGLLMQLHTLVQPNLAQRPLHCLILEREVGTLAIKGKHQHAWPTKATTTHGRCCCLCSSTVQCSTIVIRSLPTLSSLSCWNHY